MAAMEKYAAKAPSRKKGGVVLCVGWRVFVHSPSPALPAGRDIPLTDVNGNALPNDLADGQQVEILSWRPRSRDGLLYQIRRVADGREGWIPAQHLRREAVPPSVGAAAVVTGD